MSTGRLIRDHQHDRELGVGTVARDRREVLREMIKAAEAAGDEYAGERLAILREIEADEAGAS